MTTLYDPDTGEFVEDEDENLIDPDTIMTSEREPNYGDRMLSGLELAGNRAYEAVTNIPGAFMDEVKSFGETASPLKLYGGMPEYMVKKAYNAASNIKRSDVLPMAAGAASMGLGAVNPWLGAASYPFLAEGAREGNEWLGYPSSEGDDWVRDMTADAVTSLAPQAALSGISGVSKFLGSKSPDAPGFNKARKLRQQGLGIRDSENAFGNDSSAALRQGVVEGDLAKSYRVLQEDGMFNGPVGRDPEKMLIQGQKQIDAYNATVAPVIDQADSLLQGRIERPSFSKSMDYIQSQPSRFQDQLLQRILDTEADINLQGGNIKALQQVKREGYRSTNYNADPEIAQRLNELQKVINNEVKTSIEQNVERAIPGGASQIAEANRRVGAYYDWMPVLSRAAGKLDNQDIVKNALGRFTAVGKPAAAAGLGYAASGGNPLAAYGMWEATRAIDSPTGRLGLAQLTEKTAPIPGAIGRGISSAADAGIPFGPAASELSRPAYSPNFQGPQQPMLDPVDEASQKLAEVMSSILPAFRSFNPMTGEIGDPSERRFGISTIQNSDMSLSLKAKAISDLNGGKLPTSIKMSGPQPVQMPDVGLAYDSARKPYLGDNMTTLHVTPSEMSEDDLMTKMMDEVNYDRSGF